MEHRQPDLWRDPPPDRPRTEADPPFGDKIRAMGDRQAAERLVRWLRAHDYSIALNDSGGIRVSPVPPDDLLSQLKAVRDALIGLLRERP
jgi:hypothetical protein